jgi:hypothetical protein
MKVTVQVEWRKLGEPIHQVEEVILHALRTEGFTTGHIQVQGDPMEDKTLIPFSDQERLPHEQVAHLSNHKNMQPVDLEKTKFWKVS